MSSKLVRILIPAILIIGGTIVAFTIPTVRERLIGLVRPDASASTGKNKTSEDEHAGHDHAGHSEANSIEISKQAQANIGLKLSKVELTTFDRTITIPGILRERPGRSTVDITAPLTGIVTQIYPIEGEAVRPGQKLFDLRLTHEELVQAQGHFLRVAKELDVIDHEVKRLEKIAVDGAMLTPNSGKVPQRAVGRRLDSCSKPSTWFRI